MRFVKSVLFVAGILLILPGAVKAAEGDALTLSLDSGFVNRPVELAVFQGDVTIRWDAGVLVAPTVLEIRETASDVAIFSFEDPAALASGATAEVVLRVQEGVNAVEVTSGSETKTIAASVTDGLLTASVPVSSDMIVTPVQSEEAEEAVERIAVDSSAPIAELVATDEELVLMLDSGFVGRPVSLDVFGGELTVAWDGHALVAPTTLRLTRTKGGVIDDQTEAAEGVRVLFSDSAAVDTNGEFTLTHRALRPPEASEQVEVNVFGDSGVDTTQAAFLGESVTYMHAAANRLTFAPMYREGIMCSGTASWYRYKGCLCAASPDVPKGTRMKVSRQDDPGVFTVVTINDWGPDRSVHPERVIDLDYVAFDRIGNPRGGVLAVDVEVLEEDDPLYELGDELPPPPWKW